MTHNTEQQNKNVHFNGNDSLCACTNSFDPFKTKRKSISNNSSFYIRIFISMWHLLKALLFISNYGFHLSFLRSSCPGRFCFNKIRSTMQTHYFHCIWMVYSFVGSVHLVFERFEARLPILDLYHYASLSKGIPCQSATTIQRKSHQFCVSFKLQNGKLCEQNNKNLNRSAHRTELLHQLTGIQFNSRDATMA